MKKLILIFTIFLNIIVQAQFQTQNGKDVYVGMDSLNDITKDITSDTVRVIFLLADTSNLKPNDCLIYSGNSNTYIESGYIITTYYNSSYKRKYLNRRKEKFPKNIVVFDYKIIK